MESRWRQRCAPIIAAVLSGLEGEPDKVIRRALRDVYPFGPKQYHPYRIWCDEIHNQMGTKKPKVKEPQIVEVDPSQESLF